MLDPRYRYPPFLPPPGRQCLARHSSCPGTSALLGSRPCQHPLIPDPTPCCLCAPLLASASWTLRPLSILCSSFCPPCPTYRPLPLVLLLLPIAAALSTPVHPCFSAAPGPAPALTLGNSCLLRAAVQPSPALCVLIGMAPPCDSALKSLYHPTLDHPSGSPGRWLHMCLTTSASSGMLVGPTRVPFFLERLP